MIILIQLNFSYRWVVFPSNANLHNMPNSRLCQYRYHLLFLDYCHSRKINSFNIFTHSNSKMSLEFPLIKICSYRLFSLTNMLNVFHQVFPSYAQTETISCLYDLLWSIIVSWWRQESRSMKGLDWFYIYIKASGCERCSNMNERLLL